VAAVAEPFAADLLADGAHGLQRLTRDLEEVRLLEFVRIL